MAMRRVKFEKCFVAQVYLKGVDKRNGVRGYHGKHIYPGYLLSPYIPLKTPPVGLHTKAEIDNSSILRVVLINTLNLQRLPSRLGSR
jgi:hypothetical protein